jgi:hypothetical protein
MALAFCSKAANPRTLALARSNMDGAARIGGRIGVGRSAAFQATEMT